MAVEKVTFTLTLDYDPDEHGGMPARNFLYHFINRLNRSEVKVSEVGYKGTKFDASIKDLSEMPLKKVDSLRETALPKAPLWLKDRTQLAPEINEKVALKMERGEQIIRT